MSPQPVCRTTSTSRSGTGCGARPGHFGSTILIIEHDLDLVRSVCSTITVLNFGEVLATGDRTTVLSNPKVIAAYMGETEML